jgi:hypothetical protein
VLRKGSVSPPIPRNDSGHVAGGDGLQQDTLGGVIVFVPPAAGGAVDVGDGFGGEPFAAGLKRGHLIRYFELFPLYSDGGRVKEGAVMGIEEQDDDLGSPFFVKIKRGSLNQAARTAACSVIKI